MQLDEGLQQNLTKNNSDNAPIFPFTPIKVSKGYNGDTPKTKQFVLKTQRQETFWLIQLSNQVSGVSFLTDIKMSLHYNFHIFKIKTLQQWKKINSHLEKYNKNTIKTHQTGTELWRCASFCCVCVFNA